jgi:hypothetical protein
MDEIEILRGAKIRVTTQTVTVGGKPTPVVDIRDASFVEADHSIKLLPKILFVAGPVAGAAIHLLTGQLAIAIIVGLAIMATAAILLRDSWLHHVNARLYNGHNFTLYRTGKKGDALLLHAAIEKAIELRAPTT